MKKTAFKIDNSFKINIYYYIKILSKKSGLIIFSTLLSIVFSYVLIKKYDTLHYQAITKIIKYDKRISMPKDVPYKFQNFNYDTALQTIRTRKNLNQLIKELKLNTSIEKLYSSFEIRRKRKSDIIEIFYTNKDINLAVKGANTLALIFLKNFHEIQNAASKEVYLYYKIQKQELLEELKNLYLKEQIFNKKNKVLSLKVQKDYKYKQINEIVLKLIEAKVLQKEEFTNIHSIKEKLNQLPKEVKLKYSLKTFDLKNIEIKEKELLTLKQKYTNANPKIKNLKNKIEFMKIKLKNTKLENNIPDEIIFGKNPIYTSLQLQLYKSKININSIKSRILKLIQEEKVFRNDIFTLNILEKEYLIISKKIKNKNDFLNLVSKRLNELRISIKSTQEDFKILEKAKKPKYPKKSYFKIFVILSTAFVMFFSLLSYYILKTFFNHKIHETFDIKNRFNIKLLAYFKESKIKKTLQDQKLFFINNFCKLLNNKKIILFTSDINQTGKSYMIDILTYFFSHNKQSVLYIQTVDEQNIHINDALIDYSKKEMIDFTKVNKVDEYIDKLYILNNEKNSYFLSNAKSNEYFFKLLKQSNYEYVFYELPSYEKNPYFFSNLSFHSDLIINIFRLNFSNRELINKMIKEIIDLKILNVKGVLNVIN